MKDHRVEGEKFYIKVIGILMLMYTVASLISDSVIVSFTLLTLNSLIIFSCNYLYPLPQIHSYIIQHLFLMNFAFSLAT